MTEETKTEQGEAEAKTKAEAEAKPKSEERRVPESAIINQAEKFNATISKLQKQLDGIGSEKIKAEEARLAKVGEHEKIISSRDEEIATMKAAAGAQARQLLEGTAREKLRDLGMTKGLTLSGAIGELPADATAESVETWAAQMKVDHAADFVEPSKSVKQANVGDADTGAGAGDLETRLKSEDKKVRKAALDEKLKNDLGYA